MNRVAIRVIGAPLLLAALAGCLYIDWKRIQKSHSPIALPTVLCFFSVWSFHELCAMGRLKGLKPYEWIGWVLLPLPFVAAIFEKRYGVHVPALRMDLLVLLATLTGLAFVLCLVAHVFSKSARSTLFTLFTFGYMNLLACTLIANRGEQFLWWLLFLLATAKGSDMAAYIVGKSIGRHKMAPRISPNKTWEGAVGGLIAGTALGWWVLKTSGAGVVLVLHTLDPVTGIRPPCTPEETFAWYHLVAMAAVVCAAAQLGDLVKSAVKRWAGVKDSGKLLPEFGGTLDMVDSFILNAPAAILSYKMLQLITTHGC